MKVSHSSNDKARACPRSDAQCRNWVSWSISKIQNPYAISASARQIRCRERQKVEFYESLEDILLKLDSDVVLAGDLKNHIGKDKKYLNSHGRWAYETINPEE